MMANIVHITTPRLQQMRGLLQSQRTVWLLIMKEGGGLFLCLHYMLCFYTLLGQSSPSTLRQSIHPPSHLPYPTTRSRSAHGKWMTGEPDPQRTEPSENTSNHLSFCPARWQFYCWPGVGTGNVLTPRKTKERMSRNIFQLKFQRQLPALSQSLALGICSHAWSSVGGGGQRNGSWGWKGATSNAPNKISRPRRVTFVVTNKTQRKRS